MLTDDRARSIRNLSDSVVLDAKIPHRVLAEEFRNVFVMDYQGLLEQTTVDLVKMLLKYEGSTTAVPAQLELKDTKKNLKNDRRFGDLDMLKIANHVVTSQCGRFERSGSHRCGRVAWHSSWAY